MNDGKEFEFEVRQLLQLMGLDAEVTGYSQDGGVDLIAINPNPLTGGKCVVQCKATSAPVGEPVLRDLFGTMHAQGANKGILITTSTFTAAALRFAQGKPLELIDGAQYRELCEQYGLAAYGLAVETALDELLQPDSPNVRITSLDCTDPDEHKAYQHYVFGVGRLSIGSSLTFDAPGVGSFKFHNYSLTTTSSHGTTFSIEQSLDAIPATLELTFTTDGSRGTDTYCISFEGRSDLIEALYRAATPKMSAAASASSGCLLMLALPLALSIAFKLFSPRY